MPSVYDQKFYMHVLWHLRQNAVGICHMKGSSGVVQDSAWRMSHKMPPVVFQGLLKSKSCCSGGGLRVGRATSCSGTACRARGPLSGVAALSLACSTWSELRAGPILCSLPLVHWFVPPGGFTRSSTAQLLGDFSLRQNIAWLWPALNLFFTVFSKSTASIHFPVSANACLGSMQDIEL